MSERARSLDAQQLRAYFALMEASSLLLHAVEQHLREEADLSYVQFGLLARLSRSPTGSERMTDLAEGVVYSRSGLTYQAGLLEKARLITREASPGDERSITVTITEAGRRRLAKVLPGHIEVVNSLLFAPLSPDDVESLYALLAPVCEHMRATLPGSAARRKRRPGSKSRRPARRTRR